MGKKVRIVQYLMILLCMSFMIACGMLEEKTAQKKRNEQAMEPKCIAFLDETLGEDRYCLRKISQVVVEEKAGKELYNQYNVLFEKDGKCYTYSFTVDDNMEIVGKYTDLYTEKIRNEIIQFLKTENIFQDYNEIKMRFVPDDIIGEDLMPDYIHTLEDLADASEEENTARLLPEITLIYYDRKEMDPEDFPVLPVFEKLKELKLVILNKERKANAQTDIINRIMQPGQADSCESIAYDRIEYYRDREKKQSDHVIHGNYQHNGIKGTEDYRFLYNDHFYDVKIYFRDQTFDIEMFKIEFGEPERLVRLDDQTVLKIQEDNAPKMMLCWGPVHEKEILVDEGNKKEYEMKNQKSIVIFDGSINEDILNDIIRIEAKKRDS